MRRRFTVRVLVLAGLALPHTALGQAGTSPATIDLEITARRFDEARGSIQPSLGATTYDFTPRTIENVPQGESAPLNQVLLRAPGVVQDSFGQVHVRGDHGNLQYRLDGVQLPEGLSIFNQVLATRFADRMSLITGALPAQYGFRTAGIIDMTLKSGTTHPGAEASMTAGSRDYLQPSLSYGGRSGAIDYFATGQFLHSGAGIENPEPTPTAIHNDTDQWHALAKITGIVDDETRLSFVAGGASARYQIPQRSGVVADFPVFGFSQINSALLDQRQWEDTYFGMLTVQKRHNSLDFQISAFSRYSQLSYQPDALGDLMFNGIAPWAGQQSFAAGLQGDGSWKAATDHTVRGGFLVQRERATSLTHSNVLPVDAAGDPTSDQPMGIVQGGDNIGWLLGIYLQDEWRAAPTVTVNFGLRFDAYSARIAENQLSPRINVVWKPNDVLTFHAGYARYFTPPPVNQVNDGAIQAALGTTGASPDTLNDPIRAERSNYFDAGFELRPLPGLRLGIDAYYRQVENLLDKGQFGAPIVLSYFNYANAHSKGIELSASYDDGPWSVFGNLAWSNTMANNINSAQFNFDTADLTFISQNYIYVDHDQGWTASAGAAYVFNHGSDWATRVSADLIYGSGLRRTLISPNDSAGQPYAVVNLSATQKIPIKGTRGAQVRFDVLNVFDTTYQIRDGTGVGVGAPQYGLRRTFLIGLSQKF
ncbi:MAG: TonB-dependent receptor [Enhydrobacter sp.]|nr:MAG: TonB-dependent receptor [Enhydrobacter sp.]